MVCDTEQGEYSQGIPFHFMLFDLARAGCG